jgi:HEAT repeat protein
MEEPVEGPAPPQQVADAPHVRPADNSLESRLARVDGMASATELMNAAFRGGDPRPRIAALRALTDIDPDGTRPHLERLVWSASETPKMRAAAASILGRTGPEALPLILEILASDESVRTRKGAVRGLGELGTRAAAERLLAILSGPPTRLRDDALTALGRMTGADAVETLGLVARDPRTATDVRETVCVALGAGKHAEAAPHLLAVVAMKDTPVEVRRAAAEALGRSGNAKALPELVALEDLPRSLEPTLRTARIRLRRAAAAPTD